MSILDNEIVRTVSIRSARTRYFGGSDGMANFLGPLLGEYGELYIDPSGCVARKLEVEARAKARHSDDCEVSRAGGFRSSGAARSTSATP